MAQKNNKPQRAALRKTAVSGSLHLPTKEEIMQTLYKCAKTDKTDEGIKMERLFEKEAEAILSLITGNDR